MLGRPTDGGAAGGVSDGAKLMASETPITVAPVACVMRAACLDMGDVGCAGPVGLRFTRLR